MGLKDLAARFEAKQNEIYNRYSARVDGSAQPFIEIKPNDPDRENTTSDTRFGAATSISYTRDLTRVGKFLKTNDGVTFLLRQAELQTGNTFSETRVINPLFAIGNVPNMIHIRRALTAASDLPISDPTKNPAADGSIGSAGRLQKYSKSHAIDNLKHKSGLANLFHLIPSNGIIRTIAAINSVVNNQGIVQANDRPEIDFSGQFYSTAIWKGFKPQGKNGDPLVQIGAQLRQGNLRGAISTTKTAIDSAKNIFSNIRNGKINNLINGKGISSLVQDRGNIESTNNGWRYFPTDNKDGVDRYLSNSVLPDITNPNVPRVNLGRFNQKHFPLRGTALVPDRVKSGDSTTSITSDSKYSNSAKESSNKTIANIIHTVDNVQRDVNSYLTKAGSTISKINSITKPLGIGSLSSAINNLSSPYNIKDQNPAYSSMKYQELSLQARYAAMNSSLKDSALEPTVDSQKSEWQATFSTLTQTKSYGSVKKSIGIHGGFNAGDTVPDDIGTKRIKFDGGRYFHDDSFINQPIINNAGANEISNDKMGLIRRVMNDTTDFVFFDYINKKALPFRAFLTNLNESISPNISEQQYIGRIERNIVYIGVLREVSFEFRVQAFSAIEMDSVWKKINYLTSLTFPAKYTSGFLVPPFIRLTIGDVFRDQAGYIRSLNYKLDDSGWEIDDLYQAPQGITVNITFSIIENRQMSAERVPFVPFYPVGQARKETKAEEPRTPTGAKPSSAQSAASQIAGKISPSASPKKDGTTATVDQSGKPIRKSSTTSVASKSPKSQVKKSAASIKTTGVSDNVFNDRARVQEVDIGKPITKR